MGTNKQKVQLLKFIIGGSYSAKQLNTTLLLKLL